MNDFWSTLEEGDVIHKVQIKDLVIGQQILLTKENGAAFTARVQSIAPDGTVTLAMYDAPEWTPGWDGLDDT